MDRNTVSAQSARVNITVRELKAHLDQAAWARYIKLKNNS